MKSKIKYLFIGLAMVFSWNIGQSQSLDFVMNKVTKLNWNEKEIREKQAKEVMQDSEFEPNALVSNIHANPLLINGKMLDYSTFDWSTRGILSVVKGKPETSEAQAIPFTVSIRRNGKIIADKKMAFLNKELYKIEIIEVLKFGRNGDMIIIRPTKKEDWKAKRILKLIAGC